MYVGSILVVVTLVILVILIAGIACQEYQLRLHVDDALLPVVDHKKLKSGDILLCKANNINPVRAIVTASHYSHVGLFYRCERDQLWVIETRNLPRQMLSITPLQQYLEYWKPIYNDIGVRRLVHALSQSQQRDLKDLAKQRSQEKLSVIEGSLNCVATAMDWIYNKVCLQPKAVYRQASDIHFLCTDMVFWWLMNIGILYARPVILTPDFFTGPDLLRCSRVPWHSEIYQISISD